jgi:hypothetical protein
MDSQLRRTWTRADMRLQSLMDTDSNVFSNVIVYRTHHPIQDQQLCKLILCFYDKVGKTINELVARFFL